MTPPASADTAPSTHTYPRLYAHPPATFVTASLDGPFAEWPDAGDRDPITDATLIAWYWEPHDRVSVQVHASETIAGIADPVRWALEVERRFAHDVVQQESGVEWPIGFRVWIDDKGNRSTTMRALQARWQMPGGGGDSFEDVIYGFAEREGALYRVTLAMTPGWAWWDLPPPPDKLPPKATLEHAHELYRFFIGPLEARAVRLPPVRPR